MIKGETMANSDNEVSGGMISDEKESLVQRAREIEKKFGVKIVYANFLLELRRKGANEKRD
tara:strand:- start:43 stop:225 length:183 start_codon:yes stop_codon:yes gene_type:complete